MSEITRRGQFPLLPDFADFFDPFATLLGLRGQSTELGIRVEAYLEKEAYVVRAELPGIDPDKDLDVSVGDGVLSIRAERAEERRERHHSEFRYGSFSRAVRLPEGARQDDVTATYRGGILTVRVGLEKGEQAATRKIPIATEE